MATSDETRREVVRNLRNGGIARNSEEAYVLLLSRVGIKPQLPATSTYKDAMVRLADLIDRQTCKLRFDSVHQDFVCTRCGAWFDGFQTFDGHGKWNDMRYCPNCGARVVRGDE